MNKIRILLVDDHSVVLEGMRALLNNCEDFEITGEAHNGQEAIEKIKEDSPDIVLMDLIMPGMDGLEATRRIRKQYPSVRVIMISQYEDRSYILEAIKSGVAGYIPKRALASELVAAIRIIYKDGTYLYPSVTKTLIESYKKHPQTAKTDKLTLREREILKLVAAGYSSRKISDMMGLSVKTVQNYRLSISKKLQLKNLAELIGYAMNTGLVDMDR